MLKENHSSLIFFSEEKWIHHSPPQMLNFYSIKGERPSWSSHLFYEPQWQYIAIKVGLQRRLYAQRLAGILRC